MKKERKLHEEIPKTILDVDNFFIDDTEANLNKEQASLESQIATKYVQDFTYDQKLTNDFDYHQEKPLKIESLKKIATDLKNTNLDRQHIANFDKLKMAIAISYPNLNFSYSSYNMVKCDNPSKIQYNSKLTMLEQFDEPEEFSEDTSNLQSDCTTHVPNCQICKDIYTNTIGILNLYIQNGILYIYLSGKFMTSKGYLGGINKNNIRECLEKVIELDLVRFDIDIFLKNAVVYICDEFIDIQVKPSQVKQYIRALSAFSPLCGNKYNLSKYSSTGLQFKKKANTVGSSFLIYDKYTEITDGRNSKPKTNIYGRILEDNNFSLAEGILRFETKMYKLDDMRRLLNIPKKDTQKVYLTDVLNTKSKCALIMLEVFSADEETLKDKLLGYTENPDNIKFTKKMLIFKLACQRVASLLQENNNDLVIVKNTLITEFGIENESLINQLITELKKYYFDFIIYKKPRSIKKLIELRKLISNAYMEQSHVIA